jgi:all-trans-8'-apo-beta-carotenal 15,15'-oxygenase
MLFRNRFVQTAGYRADKLTGKMTAPGTFGTRVSGGFLKNLGRTDFKNVANTHVLHANNKLFALWEGGWPHTVDPYTLENDFVAEPDGCNMNGLLNEGDAFAAHYRYDPVQHTYCGFGIKLNPTAGTTKIKLYELDGDTLESTRRTDDEVSMVYPGTGLTHDYALTQNWYVFSLPPAKINNVAALKALFGLGAFSGVIDFQNDAETAKIVLIPRMKHLRHDSATDMNVDNDNRIKVVAVPYHFSFHCANAFEDENGQVLLDMVLMNKGVVRALDFVLCWYLELNVMAYTQLSHHLCFDFVTRNRYIEQIGSDLPRDRPVWESVDWETTVTSAKYVRFQVDPIQERMTAEPKVMTTRAPEFPIIPKQLSTRKHRYAYTVASHKEFEVREIGSGPAGAIMKIDTERPENNEVLAFEPHEFVGEPAFVPKMGVDVTNPTDEDKGYLVVHVLNGIDLTTDLVILDVEARGKLEAGPVTRIRLPTFVPHGLHGIFEGVSFDF